jgi:hypothetical protein
MRFTGFWEPEKAIVRAMEFLAFKKKQERVVKALLALYPKKASSLVFH